MEPDDLIIAVGDEIDKDRNALPNDLFGACKRLIESRGYTIHTPGMTHQAACAATDFNEAKKAIEASGLRVIDPAKCMVLERMEGVPEEEGFYLGVHGRIFRWIRKRDRCIDIDNLNAKGFVTLCPPDLAFDEFPCEAIFGPIQLPPTEGR